MMQQRDADQAGHTGAPPAFLNQVYHPFRFMIRYAAYA